MRRPSITLILSGLFIAYMAHSLWTISGLFFPTPCPPNGRCIKPFIARHPDLELQVYRSLKPKVSSTKYLTSVLSYQNFSIHEEFEQVVNVSIPTKTRSNGSLHLHIFVYPRGESPFSSAFMSYGYSLQTTYAVKQATAYKLIGDEASQDVPKVTPSGEPVTHWRSRLTLSVMSDEFSFDERVVPADMGHLLRLTHQREYLPILYVDQLSNRIRDLMHINDSCKEMPLTIRYYPISIGKLRLWSQMQQSLKLLQTFGFTEKDTDEVKGIFSDTNLYLLMMTFMVAAFHMLFDILAFKNDISYWKNRRSMVGLSSRAVVWRCVSTFIVFLYLLDENTSMLVLIPAGIGTVIELWKVTKAFKMKVHWNGLKPVVTFGETSDKEKETQQFDTQAMKYLSYVLYPLCLAGAVYSLLYMPHKSWYSWCVHSLVNGVYAFGFLFMLPQLFVNYKLKSVAHLPWRAFMYKAFNTFIDDVFAFIITMPTAHRLACFRDDLIFVVYLYQRWLYPVDKTRVNEYGQSFDDEKDKETKKTK